MKSMITGLLTVLTLSQPALANPNQWAHENIKPFTWTIRGIESGNRALWKHDCLRENDSRARRGLPIRVWDGHRCIETKRIEPTCRYVRIGTQLVKRCP